MLSDKLSKREKFFFALGDFYGGGSGMFISVLYFHFLTNVLFIPPAISGTVVLITRVWDAFIDPFLGVFSDNTRTRWGRRIPGIFAGGCFVGIALTLLFLPVGGWAMWARVAYVMVSWMILAAAASLFSINYAALSGEISNDYKERNKANTLRLAISQIATLVCATVPLLLRDMFIPMVGEVNAYIIVAAVFGLIFSTAILLVAFNAKERVPMPAEKATFSWKVFLEPARIRAFRQLIIMYTFAFLTLDIVVTLFQHFMQYVAHRPGETSFVLGALIITQILTVPIVYHLTKKYSKPLIFRISVPIWIIGALALSTYNAGWSPILIYVFAALTGIGVCAVVMVPWLMFPDVVDVSELALGRRDTGAFSGVMVLLRQISSAVGIAAVGWVMQLTGFDAELGTYGQPTSAILGFRSLVVVSAAVFLGIAFWASFKIKLDEKRVETIKQALLCKREGKPLDTELQKAIDELSPDLIGGVR